MTAIDSLIACAGSWRGVSTLQDPNTGTPEESASTAIVTPVQNGHFVRLDYTWSYQSTPQQGSLVLRVDANSSSAPGSIRAHWTDSWHMGETVMDCFGMLSDEPTISLRGTWTPPEGPDWGWRIDLTPENEDRLLMVMYNIWPDGVREDLAVEAAYMRE